MDSKHDVDEKPASDTPQSLLAGLEENTPLLAALGELIFELAPEGRCIGFAGPRELLALPPEAFLGRLIEDFVPADVLEHSLEVLRQVLSDGIPRTFEYCLPMPEPHWFEARMSPAGNGNALAVVRDIHARKLAEEERDRAVQHLRESEERFRHMADHAPVKLWMSGTDALCTFFNRGWLEFTGRTLDQEMHNGWTEGVHPEDLQRCMNVYLESFGARENFRMEYRLRRGDGVYRWILDEGAPRFGPDGSFLGYIGSCIDVSDLKEAEAEVRRLNADLEERVRERTAELTLALREREVLLREIHHRVKNNLQIISSLLNLQARHLDERARALTVEAQSRVQSIALVHEKLYESKNLAEVDFRAYVNDLLRNIDHATGSRPSVTVTASVEPLHLSVDRAIPCGLLINELVTNALKHAFDEGRSGSVRVALRRTDDAKLELSVSDDGRGLAPEVDLQRPQSLGLDLVRTLAQQLRARVVVERQAGTSFRFFFEAKE